MKTVIHWKEMAKAWALVFLAGAFVGVLQPPPPFDFLVALLAGVGVMMFSLRKWTLFHFE